MATIYVETSVVSYLVGRSGRDLLISACQQATREWWRSHQSRHKLFTSQLVVAEASGGDPQMSAKRLACLKSIPELKITTEVGELAKALIVNGALPRKAEADALHVAIASVHSMDLLLTWNCRHIDNPTLKPVMRMVCVAAGYAYPEICTPLELLEGINDEK